MDDPVVQAAGASADVKAAQKEMSRIKICAQAPGIDAFEEGSQPFSGFRAGIQGQGGADAVAEPAKSLQRFAQQPGGRIVIPIGDSPGLNDDDARSQVVAQRQNILNGFDAWLEIFG